MAVRLWDIANRGRGRRGGGRRRRLPPPMSPASLDEHLFARPPPPPGAFRASSRPLKGAGECLAIDPVAVSRGEIGSSVSVR